MRTKSRLLSLMLCLFAAVSAWAAVPFTPTTIENGEFAAGTKWYTMQIGESQLYITDNGDASKITLTGHATSEFAASDLWCFVGNETDGYQLYNKQAGTGKVLASSTTMGALAGYNGTGGSTYPTLQPVDALPAGYVGKWDFAPSTKISTIEDGQFIKLHGTEYAMNNFGSVGDLAFWAEGMDAGSTVKIECVEMEADIDMDNGRFTASNANGTWHSTWSSTTVEGLTFNCGANNMIADGKSLCVYSGQALSCTNTITAPQGYVVAGYSFDFKLYSGNLNANVKLTIDGTQYTATAAEQHIEMTDLDEAAANFLQSGENKGITFSNFKVTLRKSTAPVTPSFVVFPTAGGTVPYRIPAIAQAYNGDVIAVADYRYSKADIGSGNLDLRYRISHDNGQTWDDIKTLISYQHNGGGNLHTGYGDPCIVADRESSRVMVLSCSGNVMFPSGSFEHHQGIARFYSEDNGVTWSKPYDLSDSIYNLFVNSKIGKIKSMFVGSGKISQSKTIKVGEYYRLYCAILAKDVSNVNKNYVLYSDDFGETWTVLGGIDVAPIPSGGDEPKADELPDGSVIVSSRVNGGRYFNVYRYTDSKTGAGSWSSHAFSGSENGGTASPGYTCNGEILTLPVTRKSDNKDMYLQLQSVPFGSGRVNVGIYYKGYETLEDFASGTNIAKDWEDRYQVSYISSCYSTMVLLNDNTVAFLYEDNSVNSGYDIVYKNFTIEQITDDAYTLNPDVDRHAFIAESVDGKVNELEFEEHNYVGAISVSDEAKATVNGAIADYKAEPSIEKYEAINQAIAEALANAEAIDVRPGNWYRIRNHGRAGNLYLKPEASRFSVGTSNTNNADQLFTFEPAGEDTYYLYNGNFELYLGPLGANETQPAVMSEPTSAGIWSVMTRPNGRSSIVCENKTGGNVGLHLAGDKVRLVPWTAEEESSLWYIEPVETYNITVPTSGYTTVSLPCPVELPEGVQAYLPVSETVIEGVSCLQIEEYNEVIVGPAILKAEAGTYALPLVNVYDYPMPTATEEEGEDYLALMGTLKSANVSGNVYLLNGDKFKKRSGQSGTVAANTAYYVSDNGAAELALTERLDNSIESVKQNAQRVTFFTLDGRPVSQPANGIYVTSDGRKVLVK